MTESVEAAEKHNFTVKEIRAKTFLNCFPGWDTEQLRHTACLLQHTVSWILAMFEQCKQPGKLV